MLKNRLVLNIVSILSIITIFGYLITQNMNGIFYFIGLAILTFLFTKNMIIVLGVPLILVNLFFTTCAVKEGLENNSSTEKTNPTEKTDSTEKNSSTTTTKNNKDSKDKLDSNVVLNSTSDALDTPVASTTTTDESFEVGRPKKSGGGYKVDYASTVEDAYDELNKIIGGDGIKRLTSDTQNLMKQQLQLAEAMKGMGPLIQNMAPLMEQAQGLMNGMGAGKDGLGDIMKMAQQFKPQ
jgi:hypothetical protein